jgi:hypothetical protein
MTCMRLERNRKCEQQRRPNGTAEEKPDKRGDRGRSRTMGPIKRGGGDGGEPVSEPTRPAIISRPTALPICGGVDGGGRVGKSDEKCVVYARHAQTRARYQAPRDGRKIARPACVITSLTRTSWWAALRVAFAGPRAVGATPSRAAALHRPRTITDQRISSSSGFICFSQSAPCLTIS